MPLEAAEGQKIRVFFGAGPDAADSSDQAGNPVGSLQALVHVTFNLEWRFDDVPAWFVSSKHVDGRMRQKGQTVFVLVENDHDGGVSAMIQSAVVIQSLERFPEYEAVQFPGVQIIRTPWLFETGKKRRVHPLF